MSKKHVKYHTVQTTVGAIITQPEGNLIRVLLTRRGIPPYRGKWCLPGGHIEKYETARSAIIREVKEEVGVDFDASFFGYFDEIIPEDNIHAVVLIFDGEFRGNPAAQTREVSEIKWFSFEKIRSLQLAFQHNSILEKYFDSRTS
jgi:8-oxo-dGTP diphosphatase